MNNYLNFQLEAELPIGKWKPRVGEFTEQYLERLSLGSKSKNRLIKDTVEILSLCEDPKTQKYSETGLVIGYVQSGKTLSFTTLTALARDNGYGLVIVLTGVTNILKSQSTSRLSDDLAPGEVSKDWKIFENPGVNAGDSSDTDFQEIERRLRAWRQADLTVGSRRPSILVTLLKRSSRIDKFRNLLSMINLEGIPTLVIDDESDQASPNTKTASNLRNGNDEESSTYASISALLAEIPKCTMLQYTATPQANLLAAKVDTLAPTFSYLLEPGDGYTGAETFFGAQSKYVVEIGVDEEVNSRQLPEEPPASLERALAVFWLGCAIELQNEELEDKSPVTHSMLIQVSQDKNPHSLFRKWSDALRDSFLRGLMDKSSATYSETYALFSDALLEIAKTKSINGSLENMIPYLVDALVETRIVEVNSSENAEKTVEWKKSQFWILVGGMKLDRGFTVKGITVTYMPRTISENADTLQQRARFFGYHTNYLDLCRVYLTPQLKIAFSDYMDHEAYLRSSLRRFQGKSLRDWKRDFILDASISRLTRSNVIGRRIAKSNIKNSWLTPHFLHENVDAVAWNTKTTNLFVEYLQLNFSPAENPSHWIDLRDVSKKHILFKNLETEAILEYLLTLKVTNQKDSALFLNLEFALQRSKKEEPFVDVVIMNGLDISNARGYTVDEKEGVQNVFVGGRPSSNSDSEKSYVGDTNIHTERPTLQIRLVKIANKEYQDSTGQSMLTPWVAFRPTESMKTRILLESDE